MTMKSPCFQFFLALVAASSFCVVDASQQAACAAFCADTDTEFQLLYQVSCECTAEGGAREEADCDQCVYAIPGDDNNRYCYQYSFEAVFDVTDPVEGEWTRNQLCYQTTELPGQPRASGRPVICETWGASDDYTDVSLTINGNLCPRRYSSSIGCYIPYLYDCSQYVEFADSVNLCNGDGASGFLEGWWQLEHGPAPVVRGSCGPLASADSGSDGLGMGAVLGIALGILAVMGAVVVVVVLLLRKKRQNNSSSGPKPQPPGFTGNAAMMGQHPPGALVVAASPPSPMAYSPTATTPTAPPTPLREEYDL